MANGSQLGGSAAARATDQGLSPADAHVVACASEMFLARGIDAVKMTDIAEASGMGVATLYRHFSTKAAIAAAAATFMWQNLLDVYEELVASDAYRRMDGASRLERLLTTYCDHYIHQQGFAAFLDELDRLMQAGAVSQEAIDGYELRLRATYPLFEEAYQLGRADGSVARDVDFELFYRSVAHALMSVAAKLSRGEVLPSDDFTFARAELDCLIDMAIRSLRLGG